MKKSSVSTYYPYDCGTARVVEVSEFLTNRATSAQTREFLEKFSMKRKSTVSDNRQSTAVDWQQTRRVQALLAVGRQVQPWLTKWLTKPLQLDHPSKSEIKSLLRRFFVLSVQPNYEWPVHSWPLLRQLLKLARWLEDCDRMGANWTDELTTGRLAEFSHAINMALGEEGEVAAFGPAPPVLPPRKIWLETIEELEQLRVSSEQICRMLGYIGSDGEPDLKALAAADKTERKFILRPATNPGQRPHPGRLEGVACGMAQEELDVDGITDDDLADLIEEILR